MSEDHTAGRKFKEAPRSSLFPDQGEFGSLVSSPEFWTVDTTILCNTGCLQERR